MGCRCRLNRNLSMKLKKLPEDFLIGFFCFLGFTNEPSPNNEGVDIAGILRLRGGQIFFRQFHEFMGHIQVHLKQHRTTNQNNYPTK